MKLKLTICFKNGCKVEMIKRIDDPPKGTNADTHYMLEAHELVDMINQNGLCLSISPAQIGNILIQPKPEGKNGSSTSSGHKRQAVPSAGLQSASASGAL